MSPTSHRISFAVSRSAYRCAPPIPRGQLNVATPGCDVVSAVSWCTWYGLHLVGVLPLPPLPLLLLDTTAAAAAAVR